LAVKEIFENKIKTGQNTLTTGLVRNRTKK